jgi:hypothetical protein
LTKQHRPQAVILKNTIGSLEWFEVAGYKFKNPRVSFRIAGVGYEAQDVEGVSVVSLCNHSPLYLITPKGASLLFDKVRSSNSYST